jgi:hypothetical protein
MSAEFWARQLVAKIPPSWSRTTWDGLIASVPAALSPAEIAAVQKLNSNLAALSAIRLELIAPAWERIEYRSHQNALGHTYDLPIIPVQFSSMAPAAWADCEAIALEILQIGNPLRGSNGTNRE